MGRLQRRADEFKRLGARLVIVSSDVPKFLKKLKKDKKLTKLTLLSDSDLKLITALGTQEGKRRISRPATFVIDDKGRIRWRYIGKHLADRPSEAAILSQLKRIAQP